MSPFVPVEPQWGNWGTWSVCSSLCNHGTRTRYRECVGGVVGEGSCVPVSGGVQVDKCNEDMCTKGLCSHFFSIINRNVGMSECKTNGLTLG